jgi:hypothetical protein
LKEAQFNESHVMTLRPMEYFQPSNGEKYVFKGGESQTDFLQCLNTMEGDSLEEKRETFLFLVIWEPINGQHIFHACQVLAKKDLALGQLSQQQFDKLFVKRPTVVIAYNEEWKYLIASFKKNDENTERKYHSIIGETLEKAWGVWKEFGYPNPYNEDDVKRRRLFFQCLPGIVGDFMKGGSNELSMTKMNLRFRDYISMATVNANCWVALKNMCDSNDQGFTYFSEKAKKKELQDIQTGGNKSKKKNPFECRRMAIRWLRPLQGISSNDFILLCQGAIVTRKDEDQKVYLGPTSRGGEDEKHTLIYLADMSKLRSGIHNAIKWLHAEGLGDPKSKKNWILRDIERYRDMKTLNYFGRDATKEFRNAWVHVKEFTAFDTMEKYKALIPYKLQNHVKLILEGKHGLFVDGKEVIVKDDTIWDMEFTYAGERGVGLRHWSRLVVLYFLKLQERWEIMHYGFLIVEKG